MKHSLPDLIETKRNVHVLYAYGAMQTYLQTVVSYILDSIQAKETIILIENERIYRQIKKELQPLLSKKDMEFIHFINSFDFYFSSGSYHPPAIAAYFEKTVQPYLENQEAFRSWAHVEWSSMEEPHHLIDDLEKIIDHAVNELQFPLICAYKKANMPIQLETMLIHTHPYKLIENPLLTSVPDPLTVKKRVSQR
ncbi:MEDS domain-containing protein [Jeotgalibacillus sp. JSM ZJ347]|uniref:MEDS domain-containing protein n=1 Tax=Jeotgalibacillus sp. JSM ZJ347 TaxID=3342117 RepID=UPI0035A81971